MIGCNIVEQQKHNFLIRRANDFNVARQNCDEIRHLSKITEKVLTLKRKSSRHLKIRKKVQLRVN